MIFDELYRVKNEENQDQEEFLNRVWYRPYCNEKEIDRILSPQNAKDFLLKKRAEIVADNVRFFRVYLAMSKQKSYVSFENTFSERHYNAFISKLSPVDKAKCKSIVYGDIFANDFNGYAVKEEKWGNILYLNTSLHFFSIFMGLALLDFKTPIPQRIRLNALRIAVRIAIKSESFDFSLDPRGIIPKEIREKVNKISASELQYIAGHEFSHFLCGHLKDSNLKELLTFSVNGKQYFDKVYNNSQLDEFEADINSITRPNYSKRERKEIIKSALIWFISLDIIEFVDSVIAPRSNTKYLSHPSAKDRFDNIAKNFKDDIISISQEVNQLKKRAERFKLFLQQDLSVNYDFYDMYGSAYLDKPNTKWRGKELIDRVDY